MDLICIDISVCVIFSNQNSTPEYLEPNAATEYL